MASFNRVILLGRLARDVELTYSASGVAIGKVGLAVNDKRKDRDGQYVDEVTFVDLTMFGRTAEVASEYTSKGKSLLVEGRLKQDRWENNEGEKRTKLHVIVEKLQLLGGGSGGGNSSGAEDGPSGYETGEDVPF